MNNLFIRTFISLFLALFIVSAYAQNGVTQPERIPANWPIPDYSDECLGIHCYISVDLQNDPVVDGYFKYTIPAPRESIDFISGPASAYFVNLGNTIDVYVRRTQLELALADQSYAQVGFGLFVQVWQDAFGNKSTIPSSINQQCYYLIVFNMNTLQ